MNKKRSTVSRPAEAGRKLNRSIPPQPKTGAQAIRTPPETRHGSHLAVPQLRGENNQGVIHRYARYLPVSERTPVITLNEGTTPLIRADAFVAAIGGQCELC